MRMVLSYGAATILAAGFLSGPAAAQETTIRVAFNADIRSTTPGTNRDDNTDAVILHTVEGLVAYREDLTVGPLLADSVEMSDDGLTYTFRLRDGVVFHNGEALTSAEVLWSWERYLDPATEWWCLPDLDGSKGLKIESIEAPDDMTVVFTLNQPSALFLDIMARTDCGGSAIIHPDSVAEDGSWVEPIGTGPFTLGEWRHGQSITVEKFDGYVSREGERDGYTGGKEVLVDAVEFVIIPDPSAAKAALLAGDIDIIPDISSADQDELSAAEGIEIATSPTMGTNVILFQTRDPMMDDPALREAIATALDIPQIVAAVTNGNAEANNSIVPSASSYHTEVQQQGFTYDPARVEALLEEAGYQGEEIVMLTNTRYPSSYDTAVYAQAMLQAAGINARLEVLEWGTQLDAYTSGNYQMMAFPYSARFDPALSFDAVMGDKDEQPRKAWDNPEAQALLREAMAISDPAERQALFDELHRMFIADVPLIMLYNGAEVAAYSDAVEGYQPWPASKPRLWGVSLGE